MATRRTERAPTTSVVRSRRSFSKWSGSCLRRTRRRPSPAICQQLKTEYAFWMEGANELAAGGAHRRVVALDDGSILNRYWDDSDAPRDESYREDVVLAAATQRPPAEIYRDIRAAAESGWDFSSRWFADARTLASIDTTEIIPVDLNSAAVRPGECDSRRLRTGRRSRLRRGLRQPRRRAARGDRSLSLGSIPRRLSRLSLDDQAAH